MSDQLPFDPRAVANLMLDVAQEQAIALDHFALQKLLYFAHGFSLRAGQPLVSGGFEAWTYGPVQPAVWRCFKDLGQAVVQSRATKTNPVTGVTSEVPAPNSDTTRELVRRVLVLYGGMPTNRLIELSHAKGAPWDVVVNRAKTSISLGMKIPDSLIKERFGHHKVPIGESSDADEPYEDAPFTGNGFS